MLLQLAVRDIGQLTDFEPQATSLPMWAIQSLVTRSPRVPAGVVNLGSDGAS
jgi:hypothetical protein